MKVLIPSPLLSYTNEREVDASGATIAELLADLDRRYPGLRFRVIDERDRVRAHMRFFVNGEQVFDLTHALRPTDAVQLVQALAAARPVRGSMEKPDTQPAGGMAVCEYSNFARPGLW